MGRCRGAPTLCALRSDGGRCALLEIAVQECSGEGVACCRNLYEAGHMLAERRDEVRWICWVGGRSQ
jgi:hypothetical protein